MSSTDLHAPPDVPRTPEEQQIDTGAARCHNAAGEEAMPKLKPPKTLPVPKSLQDAALDAAIGDKKICRTCVRDPDKIPSAKVISNGQCAACYNRDRRKAKAEEEGRRLAPAPSRAGAAVEGRLTVRTSTDFKARMEKVAQDLGKSVSDWAASYLEPALLKDEAKAAARTKRAAR